MRRERFDGGSLAELREMQRKGEDLTSEARLAEAEPATAGNRFWVRARWVEPVGPRSGGLSVLIAALGAVRRYLSG